jgi:hypothetical protein
MGLCFALFRKRGIFLCLHHPFVDLTSMAPRPVMEANHKFSKTRLGPARRIGGSNNGSATLRRVKRQVMKPLEHLCQLDKVAVRIAEDSKTATNRRQVEGLANDRNAALAGGS